MKNKEEVKKQLLEVTKMRNELIKKVDYEEIDFGVLCGWYHALEWIIS